LDENMPAAVAEGLRRRGVDVLTVQEAGLRGASDESHVAYAQREGRVVVTQDVDFLRIHTRNIAHGGIVFAPQTMPIGAVISGLMLIHELLDHEELIGHVEFL
jgi:hypothetical protein